MVGPVLRMLVSLGIVLALMYVAARLLSRTKGIGTPRPSRRSVSLLARGQAAARGEAAARRQAGRGRRSARSDSPLELVARQPLGKAASVSLLRVAGKLVLVGVTDTSVRLLRELDDDEREREEETADLLSLVTASTASAASAASAASGAVGFADAAAPVTLLDQLRERTVRRA
jgi:flagellar protein FliO/FliZ